MLTEWKTLLKELFKKDEYGFLYILKSVFYILLFPIYLLCVLFYPIIYILKKPFRKNEIKLNYTTNCKSEETKVVS